MYEIGKDVYPVTRVTKPLRILFLISADDLCDGIARHILSLAGNLKNNMDVGVCITHKPGELSAALTAIGVKVYNLHVPHGHDPHIPCRFKKVLNDFRPDIIHGHVISFYVGLYLGLFSRQIPLIVTIHGFGDAVKKYQPVAYRIINWVCSPILNRRIAKTIIISTPVKKWIDAHARPGHKETVVCYNPITLNEMPRKDNEWLRRELRIPSDVCLIGMAGRMAEQKDWFSFIKICACLHARQNCHFIAIGDGFLLPKLQQEVARLQLNDRFHWLGYRLDARRIIGALDLYLITSVWEGMPTVLLEAFAMRTPVVGFVSPGGVEEVFAMQADFGRVACLIQERDCQRVADQVVQLLKDVEAKEALVERAYRLVQSRFDTPIVCAQLAAIYREVLENTGRKETP